MSGAEEEKKMIRRMQFQCLIYTVYEDVDRIRTKLRILREMVGAIAEGKKELSGDTIKMIDEVIEEAKELEKELIKIFNMIGLKRIFELVEESVPEASEEMKRIKRVEVQDLISTMLDNVDVIRVRMKMLKGLVGWMAVRKKKLSEDVVSMVDKAIEKTREVEEKLNQFIKTVTLEKLLKLVENQ